MEHLLLGTVILGIGFVVGVIVMSMCALSGSISRDEERRRGIK